MTAWREISKTVHDFISDEVVYTLQELSDRTGVSVQTLHRWDRSGKFIAMRCEYHNRSYKYYTEEQLNQLVESDLYLEMPMIKNRDLIGRTIGKLYVRDFSEAAIRKGYYGSYTCECECGNIIDVPRSELISGKHLSCGCRFHNLSGRIFGYWHVDSLADDYYTPGGSKAYRYNCTCRCGTKRVIFARSLLSGASQSCGCLHDERMMSKYEFCVVTYLESVGFVKNVSTDKGYVQHKTYDGLTGVGGNLLSYDFYVWAGDYSWLIECQGGQHYFPVPLWGGEDAFKKQKEHDFRKRKYAEKLGVPLIEIPYSMFNYDDVTLLLKESGIR